MVYYVSMEMSSQIQFDKITHNIEGLKIYFKNHLMALNTAKEKQEKKTNIYLKEPKAVQ